MKVITVTLNPAIERTLMLHFLAVGYQNHTTQTARLDPTGRGVNISRALHRLDVETIAIILLGNDPIGIAYDALITEEMLPVHLVSVQGRTRSQTVLLDTGSKQETIIIEDNEGFSRAEVDRTTDVLREIIQPGDYVVYAGPLPKDLPAATYIGLIEEAVAAGGKVILDLPNPALHEAIRARPAMVCMTQNELEGYFNMPVRSKEGVAYCASKLRAEGADHVLVLLSHEVGAILATAEEMLYIHYPSDLQLGTHGGTISAMIAGYLAGQVKERAMDKALRLGMAASLYTIQQVGVQFPRPADLPEFMRQVEINPLPNAETLNIPLPPETA